MWVITKAVWGGDWSLVPSKAITVNQMLYGSIKHRWQQTSEMYVVSRPLGFLLIMSGLMSATMSELTKVRKKSLDFRLVRSVIKFWMIFFCQDALAWFSLRSWLPAAVWLSSSVEGDFLWSVSSGQASLSQASAPVITSRNLFSVLLILPLVFPPRLSTQYCWGFLLMPYFKLWVNSNRKMQFNRNSIAAFARK